MDPTGRKNYKVKLSQNPDDLRVSGLVRARKMMTGSMRQPAMILRTLRDNGTPEAMVLFADHLMELETLGFSQNSCGWNGEDITDFAAEARVLYQASRLDVTQRLADMDTILKAMFLPNSNNDDDAADMQIMMLL